MKNLQQFAFTLLGCLIALSGFSQAKITDKYPFTDCSAALLNNIMIVDEYSPEGKCVLDSTATGTLTVCTMELWPEKEKCRPTSKLKFMVAFRDHNTKTLMMYSNKVYEEIEISKLTKACRKGYYIVLLTMKDQYALPHNEILLK